jgi:Fe-S-cluster containining protein
MAIMLDKPKTKEDFENIKWHIYHKDVQVYIDVDNDWYVEFLTPCENLVDNKCKIYDKKPPLCRDFTVEECEKNKKEVEVLFKTVKDYEKYLRKNNIL